MEIDLVEKRLQNKHILIIENLVDTTVAKLSVKGQIVNIFYFAGHIVSVTTQLCYYSTSHGQ